MSEPTLIQKLTAAQDAIAALTAERDTLKAELETSVAKVAKTEEEASSLLSSAAQVRIGMEKQFAETAAKLEAEATARKEAEQAQANTAAELAKAKAALANPAFVDAAMTGTNPVADSGSANFKSEISYSEFQKLNQSERMAFSVRGGKITA